MNQTRSRLTDREIDLRVNKQEKEGGISQEFGTNTHTLKLKVG